MDINVLNIYLPEGLCRHLQAGKTHPFFSAAFAAFSEVGFRVNFLEDSDEARLNSMTQNAYAMFHYKDPFHARALDVRSAYIGPFYKLENETYRQDFRTANMVFRPSDVSVRAAQKFFAIWQKKVAGTAHAPVPYGRYILVPLQGKLTVRRVGQSMSPMDMVQTTLRLDPGRDIVVKPHPKEDYSAEELAALEDLAQIPRVHIYEGDLNPVLAGCDYVVTQNSSVALKGLFHKKPGILFAHSEFHHAFQSVPHSKGVEQCFNRVLKHTPNYAKFIYWFFQLNCINTSRGWVKPMILEHCREFGWDIPMKG